MNPTHSVTCEVARWPAHTKGICALSWSPDGETLASAGNDGIVHLWEPRTGTLVRSFEGHARPVRSVDWSARGGRLLSGSEAGDLAIWDRRRGTELHRHRDHGAWINSVTGSPDGRYYASASGDRSAIVYDAVSHAPVVRLKSALGCFMSTAWSDDGRYFAASARSNLVVIWRAADWQVFRQLDAGCAVVWTIEWWPNRHVIASGGDDGRVVFWDVERGCRIAVIEGHEDTVARVTFSRSGEFVASLSHDETVAIWRRTDLAPVSRVDGVYPGWVHCLAFHPSKPVLAGTDPHGRAVCLWRIDEGRQRPGSQSGISATAPPGYTSPRLAAVKSFIAKSKADGRSTVSFADVATPGPAGVRLDRSIRCAAMQLQSRGELRLLETGDLYLSVDGLRPLAAALVRFGRSLPRGDGVMASSAIRDALFPGARDLDRDTRSRWRIDEQALAEHVVDSELGWYGRERGRNVLCIPAAAIRPLPAAIANACGASATWRLSEGAGQGVDAVFTRVANTLLFTRLCLFERSCLLLEGASAGFALCASFPGDATVELTLSRIGAEESPADSFMEHPLVGFVRALLGPPARVTERRCGLDERGAAALLGSLPWRTLRDVPSPAPEADDGAAVLLERVRDEQRRQKRLYALDERRERGAYHALLCHRGDDLDRAQSLAAELAEDGILVWVDHEGALSGKAADPSPLELARRSGVIAILIGRAASSPWSEHDFHPFYRELATARWNAERRLRWIPLVLPEAPARPVLPDFLHSFDWIRWADEPRAARLDARSAFVSAVLCDRSRS